MEPEDFFAGIAARLGRARPCAAPPVPAAGPRESDVARPLVAAESLLQRFQDELELVGGKLAIASSSSDVSRLLEAELSSWNARKLVSWSLAEFEGWGLARSLAGHACASYAGEGKVFRELCRDADAGITTADFAIAGTGTLAIASGPGRPRQVSLLPTVHIALVKESQLVEHLGQAFEAYRQSGRLTCSNLHFITGPSRTSDIENDLSIGVHGPAAVSVILWRDGRVPPRSAA